MTVQELRNKLEQFSGEETIVMVQQEQGCGKGNSYQVKDVALDEGRCVIGCELIPQYIRIVKREPDEPRRQRVVLVERSDDDEE